jgi:aryl-alcohol dehydrogenase-like predicted oxidoreductase
MEQRSCGNSDLKLSVLGAGCWAFGGGDYWGDTDQQDIKAVVHRAVELGINYFDTAEAYNDGRSEKSLGQAVKGLDRAKIIIGTKISPSNCSRETLIKHCEASLERLDTEYIDLYMIHWPIHPHSLRHFTNNENIINNPPDLSETVEALVHLQCQGKIRYVGISNFAKERVDEVLESGLNIVVNELPYSLLARAVEDEMLPYCQQKGIGVIGYMTLLQGLLADIYSTLSDVPKWQRRTRHFNSKSCELCRHGEEGIEEETNKALASIRSVATDCGMTMSEIAIKWAVANNALTCAIVGARNLRKLEANIKAAAEPLAKEFVDRLNKATNPIKEKLGTSFDYYENTANDRTR